MATMNSAVCTIYTVVLASLVLRTHAEGFWSDLALMTSNSTPAVIPQERDFTCEERYSDNVHVHIIIPIVDRSKYSSTLRNLGMLGLTGADVFMYLRCAQCS